MNLCKYIYTEIATRAIFLYVRSIASLCIAFVKHMYVHYTGLFISPSGISELDCATTKTNTAERSISIGRETLQDFCKRGLGVLPGSTARG